MSNLFSIHFNRLTLKFRLSLVVKNNNHTLVHSRPTSAIKVVDAKKETHRRWMHIRRIQRRKTHRRRRERRRKLSRKKLRRRKPRRGSQRGQNGGGGGGRFAQHIWGLSLCQAASNEWWAQAWLLMNSTLCLQFWLWIRLGEGWGRGRPQETLPLLHTSLHTVDLNWRKELSDDKKDEEWNKSQASELTRKVSVNDAIHF